MLLAGLLLVYRDTYRSCINRRPCNAIGSVYPAKSLNLVILMFKIPV
jgi:hypothetical protein